MSPIVEVDNICKSFGVAKVLQGVSFTVRKGSVVAIIGPVSYTHLRAHET